MRVLPGVCTHTCVHAPTHLSPPQGLKHADFVIEAVVENEDVKKNIFRQLDKVRLCERLCV
jgi:3-hydroxyacyl-CoA dehydrogenase